jgi:hypothetical protein
MSLYGMIVRTNVPAMLPLPPVQLFSTATPEPVSLMATFIVPSLPAGSVWDIQALLVGSFTLGKMEVIFGTSFSACAIPVLIDTISTLMK